MKVLLLNTYPNGGGAAVASRRMLEALLAVGVDAKMLVAGSVSGEIQSEISGIGGLRHRVAFLTERLGVFAQVHFDRKHLFRYSSGSNGLDITEHPWVLEADVIHLHWTQQGFLSLEGLQRLLSLPGKRFFWSLHDLWPLTGGCHLPYLSEKNSRTSFCSKFLTHCGACPILHSKQVRDGAYRQFEKKLQLPLEHVHFLGVSRAVIQIAKESPLLRGAEVSLLPNMIPSELYAPAVLDQERTERRILFVAANLSDPVKGWDLCERVLESAARISPEFEREAHLIAVGKLHDARRTLERLPIRATHRLHCSSQGLIQLYQTATLTLSTSRYETFGQTLIESIACGTPALSFSVGGTPDIIDPKRGNGQLVPPYDIEAMAEQMVLLSELHRNIDRMAISQTILQFHTTNVASLLLKLYEA
ncbi:MAG: glycosyltransferase [Porphyromonas sp.]|nr:glycosyltransferase [Porphyromonas sp.]